MTMDEFGMIDTARTNKEPSATTSKIRAQRSMPAFGTSQISTSSQAAAPIDDNDPRAPSPDIETILSASTNRRRSKSASKRGSSVKRVVSDGAFASSPSSWGSSKPRRQSEGIIRAANGQRVPRRAATQDDYDMEPYDPRLERALEGVGSDEEETLVGNAIANRIRARGEGDDAGGDSDSSLDLHTPLPNLMVRHGLLSPHSKLLPTISRANTPYINGQENRPGSKMSLASSSKFLYISYILVY
jgi:hypothetical protein